MFAVFVLVVFVFDASGSVGSCDASCGVSMVFVSVLFIVCGDAGWRVGVGDVHGGFDDVIGVESDGWSVWW